MLGSLSLLEPLARPPRPAPAGGSVLKDDFTIQSGDYLQARLFGATRFTASSNYNIDAVSFMFRSAVAAAHNITYKLWADDAFATTLGTSADILDASTIVSSYAFYPLAFAAGLAVVGGTTYWIGYADPGTFDFFTGIGGSAAGGTTGSNATENSGWGGNNVDGTLNFQIFGH